jgi:hypothetical protein
MTSEDLNMSKQCFKQEKPHNTEEDPDSLELVSEKDIRRQCSPDYLCSPNILIGAVTKNYQ